MAAVVASPAARAAERVSMGERWGPALRWVQAGLALPALWQVVALASIVVARAGYPMDLEWMEGGQLYHAHRLLEGQQIYPAPSDGFLPYPYPPGHYAVLAAVGRVIGLDYAMARVISALFFAGAAVVLGLEVARVWRPLPRPAPLVAAVAAVGAIVVTYPDVAGWFDLVRNDSMALALAVAGVALCGRSQLTAHQGVVAACVFTAAIMTKQTTAFFALWAVLWIVLFQRRAAVAFAGTLVGTVGAGLIALQLATDGWFWHHTYGSLAEDRVLGHRLREALGLMVHATPYLVIGLVAAIVALAGGWLSARSVLWVGTLVAAVPAAMLPFAKVGGSVNSLMPVLVLAGPVTLMVLGDVLGAAPPLRSQRTAPWAQLAVLGAAAAFVAGNALHRGDFVPDDATWDRAERLNDYVADLDGGVLLPSQPFLAVRNGDDTPQVHTMGYLDAADLPDDDLGPLLAWIGSARPGERRDGQVPGWTLASFIERTRPRWIILGSPFDSFGPRLGWIPPEYVQVGEAPQVGGAIPGPREVLERREPEDPPDDER